MSIDATNKTYDLVTRWIEARKRSIQADREKSSADCALSNAVNDLGKWLVPKDFKPEVPFHIWFGSGILSATAFSNNSYEVKWLKKPDDKEARERGIE